jgi:hypothetical protein
MRFDSTVIVQFLQAQWVPIVLVLIVIVAYGIGRYWPRQNKQLKTFIDILAQRDASIIGSAISRLDGLPDNTNKIDYVKIIGFRLEYLAQEFKQAERLNMQLGLAALTASALSSFITGSAFFGAATIGLSFTVTSVGALSLAVMQFMGVGRKASEYLILAERLRLELTQFVGGSSEYAPLTLEQGYARFAETIDIIMGENISAHMTIMKSRITADPGDKKDAEKS